jgi:hypothetical protein
MFKTTFHKDEIVEQSLNGHASLNKMEKITKKEHLEKELPINPKFIFDDYKKNKNDKGKKYRKPAPETEGGKKKGKVISISDW